MKQRKFSKQHPRGRESQGQNQGVSKPHRQKPQAFRLHGVRSGDPMIDPPLHPNRDGQKTVIVSSIQKTIHGPGIAHVTLADNPLGRSYPISALYLPEEALTQFQRP